jgi:putative oxidoreductase
MRTLLDTRPDATLLFQRLLLALVIGAHGLQKAFGCFGGYGFEGTMRFFIDTLHVPAPLALLVILGETLGVAGLALGALTRIAAFGVTASMLGAIAMVHWQFGFFMNWGGTQGGEGFELHLLALALSVPLMFRGGGAYAIDTLLLRFIAQQQQQRAVMAHAQ